MELTISAGDLDRRIQLLRRDATKDAGGREVIAWPPRATVWASKRDVSGREQMVAGQLVAEHVTRFVLRWRADVCTTDRMLVDGVLYDVQHVAELGRREFLQVTAQRVLQP